MPNPGGNVNDKDFEQVLPSGIISVITQCEIIMVDNIIQEYKTKL